MQQVKSSFSYPFVHRLGDEAEGGTVAVAGSGVLDEDLTGVDTSFPLLAAGLYDMEIKEVSKVPNNAKTGDNLKIVVVTTKDALDVKGQRLNAGMKLTSYIGLSETPKYNQDDIKKNCAVFVQAVGCGITRINPLEQFAGKIVRAKITIRPAGPDKTGVQREAANDIKWVPAGN